MNLTAELFIDGYVLPNQGPQKASDANTRIEWPIQAFDGENGEREIEKGDFRGCVDDLSRPFHRLRAGAKAGASFTE